MRDARLRIIARTVEPDASFHRDPEQVALGSLSHEDVRRAIGRQVHAVLVDHTHTRQFQPMSALIALIEAGNVYVDIPTNDGTPPPNTGPGDIIGGELRGQVR
jgi:hypothetical protein